MAPVSGLEHYNNSSLLDAGGYTRKDSRVTLRDYMME